MFFETVRALGAILTAGAALFGLYLGVTRVARIRRREQLFRESLTALTENDPRRRIVSELHRAALADLIARQLTSNWHVTWPWLAWLVIVAVWGQAGYLAADYLGSDAPASVTGLLTATFTEPVITPIAVVAVVFGIFPMIFRFYQSVLIGRADLAHRFYNGESIDRPKGVFEHPTMFPPPKKQEAGDTAEEADVKPDTLSAAEVRSALRDYRLIAIEGVVRF